MGTQAATEQAYQHCPGIAQGHYENFPVASRLIPAQLRRPIAAIYAFARHADDLADEGDADNQERLLDLEFWEEKLSRIESGFAADHPVFIALADTIDQYRLPSSLFHDLISAFRQDVTKKRYANQDEVLDYCRRSANPVGRLLLHLMGLDSEKNLSRSDSICSALQIINFLQDIQQDLEENNRVYLPQERLDDFDVSEADLTARSPSTDLRQLLEFQIKDTRSLMLRGAPLAADIGGRFGMELRATVLGGLKILDKLEKATNPLSRPRLTKGDWMSIGWSTLATGAFRARIKTPVTIKNKNT